MLPSKVSPPTPAKSACRWFFAQSFCVGKRQDEEIPPSLPSTPPNATYPSDLTQIIQKKIGKQRVQSQPVGSVP